MAQCVSYQSGSIAGAEDGERAYAAVESRRGGPGTGLGCAVNVEVRDATPADLPATLAIYNELIGSTTVAWSEHPQTLDERRAWFERQRARNFPSLVAVVDHEIVGMTSYGDFRDSFHWPGYRFTAEHSIHVRQDRRRHGIGRLLMDELIARALRGGIHVLVGALDADNADSIRFHQTLGFVEVARLPETGFKFGHWLDLVLMQRMLDGPSGPA
ncbi:MAG: L-amino acid N-acyltransferase [Actinomycetota bacterium]|nr:L-amino acid N-acyltransferase [Actinomycetota bacterium]